MITLLLRAITLIAIVAASGWTALCLSAGRPYLAVTGLLLIAAGHSLVLGVELVIMNRSQRSAGLQTAACSDLLRAWLAESWCALRAFVWRQPFRSNAFADNLNSAANGKRGLLLIHGFLCNRGVWNGWYPRLLKSGTPFIGVSLEPAFGSIDEYVEQIESAVKRLTMTTGLPPVVVAHSMGGLAVRAWLRAGPYQGLNRLHRVVTLGSPHGGTALVKFNVSTNVTQMSLGSGWLNGLAQHEQSRLAGRFICLFSRCDNVVFPADTACLSGAQSIEIDACAHIQMVDHPVSYKVVQELLCGKQPGS